MTPAETDMARTVDQPYPPFLELLETDPALALDQFERGARAWLRSHPTASMRSLTAAERQDVIDDTIRRCLAGGGAPLRGYTDMWGSFAAWLAGVADSTCTARFGSRRARPTPTPNRHPQPGGESAEEAPTRAAAPAVPHGRSRAGSIAGATTPARSVRRPPPVHSRLGRFKKTHILVPVAVLSVLTAVNALRSTADRPGRTTVTAVSVHMDLASGESSDPAGDVVALDDVAGFGADDRPVTVVFRSGRPTVLRLLMGEPGGRPAPSRVVVEDGDGAVAWEATVDPSIVGEGFLDVRIDTRTVPSGEYTIRAVGAGAAEAFRSVFTVADQ